VDLRCYSHVLLRNDGKLSLKLPDLDKFEHTWDIEGDLPWDVATQVAPVTQHSEVLDQALIDAISLRAIPTPAGKDKRIVVSCIAFLYLYMSLALDESRCEHVQLERLILSVLLNRTTLQAVIHIHRPIQPPNRSRFRLLSVLLCLPSDSVAPPTRPHLDTT
jgi:hypothetical protein